MDARSNKVVIAGMYSGNVLLDSFPSDLSVALYIEVRAEGDVDLDLDFYLKKTIVAKGSARITGVQPTVGPATLLFPPFTMHIPESTFLEVKASVNGAQPVSVLKKAVNLRASA
jgi:hypothetical protein